MSHHTSPSVKYSGRSLNFPPAQSTFEISLSKAGSDQMRGVHISQPSPWSLVCYWGLGPDTQKHSSPTYLSVVHVTAVKTTCLVESLYSKLPLSWHRHTFNLFLSLLNSTLKSFTSNLSRVNIHRIYTPSGVFSNITCGFMRKMIIICPGSKV